MKLRLPTHGKANKGLSGLRGNISRINFTNGGYERSRNPLLALPRERYK